MKGMHTGDGESTNTILLHKMSSVYPGTDRIGDGGLMKKQTSEESDLLETVKLCWGEANPEPLSTLSRMPVLLEPRFATPLLAMKRLPPLTSSAREPSSGYLGRAWS